VTLAVSVIGSPSGAGLGVMISVVVVGIKLIVWDTGAETDGA
jgi:hypothetical protein